MNENKVNLKKASLYYFVGTLFNKGIGFITVPIFTRILTIEDYGIVTTYNSWVSMVTMIISLALYMAVRASFIDYKEKTNDFLSVIQTFMCLFGCCFSAIVLVIAYLIPMNVNIGIVALCLIQSMAWALTENLSMYFMMKYKYKARTAIMVLPNLISTIISIIVIRYIITSDLYLGRIVPNAVIVFIFGLIALIYGLRGSKIRFNKEYLSYALKISVPLVLDGVALNILSQADRMMITMIRNSTESGVYGLVYNFSMIATVIITAFDGIWIPFFTNKMNEKKYSDINKFSAKYIEMITVTMLMVVLLGPEILKLIATEVYWEGISIIPPIVLSNYIIFLYTMYVNIEHYHKKTVFISINTAIAAVVNVLLNLFFINQWGYVGAAYTTLISYTLSLILHYLYARRLNRELFPLKQFLLPSLAVAVTVIIFYVFIDIWYVRWIIAVMWLLYIVIKEKDFLLKFIRRNNENK